MRGRKAVLTEQCIADFVEHVEHVSIASAAKLVGFSHSTVQAWLKVGRDAVAAFEASERTPDDLSDHEALCVRLLIETNQARAKSELGLVQEVRAAADWKAQAWLLERRHVNEWGRRRLEVTGADGGPITLAQLDKQMRDDDEHARSVEDADGGGSLDG